jgi:hypothetical protein
MKKCPKCGFENPDDAMNCKSCRINLQFAFDNLGQFKVRDGVQEGSAAQKTINPYIFTVSLWGSFIVGLIIMLTNRVETPTVSILLPLAGMAVAQIYFLISLYRCWKIIQGSTAGTTPGMAVGFLFIPLFNMYWVYRSIIGLAKDANEFLQLNGIEKKKISVILSTLTCIVGTLIVICAQLERIYPPLEDIPIYLFYMALALENILIFYWARFFNFAVEELSIEYK